MKGSTLIGLGVLVAVVLAGSASGLYIISETGQVLITQFGRPIGNPINEPGLHWKIPFIQDVNRFEKRFLEWDGYPNQLPTKDKRFIFLDTYARWRISDPLLFFQRLRDETRAQSRLDDILDGETRNSIAKHALIEVVRTSDREFTVVPELGGSGERQKIAKIDFGRDALAEEVLAAAKERVSDFGIEILDFRFKRINYVQEVRVEVYNRMISERKRIAEQFRSEGAGEAARINGERERELRRIRSEGYKEAQTLRGKADAEAADIYARAYEKDAGFYRFLQTMDSFKKTLDAETILLLGTDGEYLRFLETSR